MDGPSSAGSADAPSGLSGLPEKVNADDPAKKAASALPRKKSGEKPSAEGDYSLNRTAPQVPPPSTPKDVTNSPPNRS